jgi:hypothetical protein
LRSAINKHCQNCIFDPIGGTGTWRQQTSACTAKTCPLWPVRPKPSHTNTQVLNALENPELGHDAPVFDVAGANHAHR